MVGKNMIFFILLIHPLTLESQTESIKSL